MTLKLEIRFNETWETCSQWNLSLSETWFSKLNRKFCEVNRLCKRPFHFQWRRNKFSFFCSEAQILLGSLLIVFLWDLCVYTGNKKDFGVFPLFLFDKLFHAVAYNSGIRFTEVKLLSILLKIIYIFISFKKSINLRESFRRKH